MDVVQLSQSRWWDNTLISRCQRWDISVSSHTTGAVTVAVIPSLCHLHTPGAGHCRCLGTGQTSGQDVTPVISGGVMLWCDCESVWVRQFLLSGHRFWARCIVLWYFKAAEWASGWYFQLSVAECLKSVPCVRCRGRPYLAHHPALLCLLLSVTGSRWDKSLLCLTHPNIFLLLTKIFLIPVTRDMSVWIRNIGTGVFWLELCIIVPVMSYYSEQELPVKYFRSLWVKY